MITKKRGIEMSNENNSKLLRISRGTEVKSIRNRKIIVPLLLFASLLGCTFAMIMFVNLYVYIFFLFALFFLFVISICFVNDFLKKEG